MSFTPSQLRSLGQKIAEDPEAVHGLSYDEALELRKAIDPLGAVISTKKCYVNMSLVNWKEKYLRKLHMTALVGYLFRTLEEYTPTEELAKEQARYERASKAPGSHATALLDEHLAREKLITSTAKGIVAQFLARNFNFNPDIHLRSAHTENASDPDRKNKLEAIRENGALADISRDIDAKLSTKPEEVYKYLREKVVEAHHNTSAAASALRSALLVLRDPELSADDKESILLKKYLQLGEISNDMGKLAKPMAAADTLSAWTMAPPADVFYHFDRYFTNHYEELQAVVEAVYNEKSDIEFAVVLYDAFKTPEAAGEYLVQHESEFKGGVDTIESGAVTLLGPFKENRSRVNFYNKNTEIMKRMMDQVESDHKLGADVMAKQAKSQKKKNIEEAGPDAPGLAAYSKAMNIASELGAKKILTKDEAYAMAEAKKTAQDIREDYEVPDDSIQVDMFFPQVGADGSAVLKKTKFYTQAETPTFMQDPSRMSEPYQTKRGDDDTMDGAYVKKTITGARGEKKEILVDAAAEEVTSSRR